MQTLLNKIPFWNQKNQNQNQNSYNNKKSLGKVIGNDNEQIDEVYVDGKKVKIPKEHKNATIEESENCPFMKMQKQKENDHNNNQLALDTEAVVPFEKKQKKRPLGGCPFMPSENKKNPGLLLDLESRYDIEYVSCKNYLISNKGFNLFKAKKQERKIYDTFPVYLKHTMFHQDNEQMQKARKCEMSQKFFIFDQFREKGNKYLKKNDLETALNCYEHALSVIRWVELRDEDDIEYEKELKKQHIENVKKREEEMEKEEKKQRELKKLEKKTKKGRTLTSHNSREQKKIRDQQLKDEVEELAEVSDYSDYEEEEPAENPEEKQKRQAEVDERQRLLYEKARQNIIQSSLHTNNEGINGEESKYKEEQEQANSDNGSLLRGVRSDDDFSMSSEELENQENDGEEQEETKDGEKQLPKKNQQEFYNIKKKNQKKEDIQEKIKRLQFKEYIVDENDDDRSDMAIGDNEDLEERKQELDRETRDENKKEERLKEFIKEQEKLERINKGEEEEEEDEDDDDGDKDKKNQGTKISIDYNEQQQKQVNTQELEKERIERERKAREMLEMEEEDKEFRKKYKIFLYNYNDENTKLHDGENVKDYHDVDMRQGMLITILTSLAIVYMKLGHFKNAIEALEDAEKVAQQKSSVIYFRKVQAAIFNQSCTLKELKQAKEDILLAMQIKQTEKMFKQEKGILKILNLYDHEEAFKTLAIQITDRVHTKREENLEIVKEFLERAAEIEEIYQDMVADGRKVAGQDDEDEYLYNNGVDLEGKKFEGSELKIFLKIQELDEFKEKEIMRLIIDKYYGMIDFYMEQMKTDKVKAIQNEFQAVLKIQNQMDFYYNLDVSKDTQDELVLEVNKQTKVDFSLERVQKRLKKLKIDYSRDQYEMGNFNFYILEYAIKEYYKRMGNLKNRLQQMQEDRLKIKKGTRNRDNQNQKPSFYNPLSLTNLFNPQQVFQIAFILFILLAVLLGLNSNFLQGLNGNFLKILKFGLGNGSK